MNIVDAFADLRAAGSVHHKVSGRLVASIDSFVEPRGGWRRASLTPSFHDVMRGDLWELPDRERDAATAALGEVQVTQSYFLDTEQRLRDAVTAASGAVHDLHGISSREREAFRFKALRYEPPSASTSGLSEFKIGLSSTTGLVEMVQRHELPSLQGYLHLWDEAMRRNLAGEASKAAPETRVTEETAERGSAVAEEILAHFEDPYPAWFAENGEWTTQTGAIRYKQITEMTDGHRLLTDARASADAMVHRLRAALDHTGDIAFAIRDAEQRDAAARLVLDRADDAAASLANSLQEEADALSAGVKAAFRDELAALANGPAARG